MLDGLDVICAKCVVSFWAAAFVTVVGVAVWLIRRRGRRRPALRWTASTFAVLVVVLAATADSVNAYYAYLPTVGDAVQAATGDRQWVPVARLDDESAPVIRRADQGGQVIRLPIPADPIDGFGV